MGTGVIGLTPKSLGILICPGAVLTQCTDGSRKEFGGAGRVGIVGCSLVCSGSKGLGAAVLGEGAALSG